MDVAERAFLCLEPAHKAFIKGFSRISLWNFNAHWRENGGCDARRAKADEVTGPL